MEISTIFKTRYFLLLCILIVAKINAQQDPQYTQYMYNTLTINPAYAGSTGALEATLLHRSQWLGVEGAPRTQAFTVQAPLPSERVGLGLSAVNDKLGPSNELFVDGNFSYTIPMSYRTRLALGIKAGARMLNVDWTKGRYYDNSDMLFNHNIDNEIKPRLGAGAFLYTDKWYIGTSVPNFIESDYYDDIKESVSTERMYFYFIGGYVFDLLSDALKFKPAFMVKAVTGAPLAVDVSANFLIQEKVTLGVSYRWDDSVSGLVGFQISPSFFVGYAYDYSTTRLNKYNDGSHEIILRYQLPNLLNGIKSPRFF